MHECHTEVFCAAYGAWKAHRMSRATHCETALHPARLLHMSNHDPADLPLCCLQQCIRSCLGHTVELVMRSCLVVVTVCMHGISCGGQVSGLHDLVSTTIECCLMQASAANQAADDQSRLQDDCAERHQWSLGSLYCPRCDKMLSLTNRSHTGGCCSEQAAGPARPGPDRQGCD